MLPQLFSIATSYLGKVEGGEEEVDIRYHVIAAGRSRRTGEEEGKYLLL